MKVHSFLLGCLLLAGISLSAQSLPPEIRQASGNPFDAKGRPVETVWKNADVLTGFNEYRTTRRAPYQTRARLLFDRDYLYFNIESIFDRRFEFVPPQKVSPFARTGIELFIQPDRNNVNFYHLAVAPGSDPYTADSFTEIPMKGLEAKVYKKNRITRVFNLRIPLKCIGLDGAAAGREIGFNICSNYFDLPKGMKKLQSTFAVIPGTGFRIPGNWNVATFSDKQEPGRVIIAASKNIRMNLMANHDFKLALPDAAGVPGWDVFGYGKTTYRQENLAMSNDWFIRAEKKAFNIFRSYQDGLDPAKEYTLKIRARGVNGPLELAVKQFNWVGKRYTKFWERRVSLSGEFAVYTIPFKPVRSRVDILFTRYGGGDKSYLDIASVELFEGKPQDLEIRKDIPAGLKVPVPGTENPPEANIIGKRAVPLKVLAFGLPDGNYSSVREVKEIFAGTGAVCDVIAGTETKTDIYTTKDDPKEITGRLTGNQYDLYMIGNWQVLQKIGEKTAEQIWKNVEKGATLILSSPKKFYVFDPLLKKCRLAELPPDHPFRSSFPGDFGKTNPNPVKAMKAASVGKGRVYCMNLAPRPNVLLPIRDLTAAVHHEFPFDDYAKAWLARIAWLAAGKVENPITSMEYSEGRFKVTLGRPEGRVPAVWKIVSESGDRTGAGKIVIKDGKAEFTVPAERVYAGLNLISVKTQDVSGKVADFGTLSFRQAGPEIAIDDLEPYRAGKSEGVFKLRLASVPKESRLEWELADFAGRVLESGTLRAAGEQTLKVPLKHVYTNYTTLRVALRQDGRTLARQVRAVIVQDRDVNRMLNEGFTQRMWGPFSGCSEAGYRSVMRQMRKSGLTLVVPAWGKMIGIPAMREGIINGMNYLGGGEIFCNPPAKNNVRLKQFNTAVSREKIRKQAEQRAQMARKLGYSFNAVCDEPNLSRIGEADELDSHPENIAEFRIRMEKKYGTIAEFNRRMHSNWGSFAEIQPLLTAEARKTGRYGEFIEWRNFNTDRWCEIIKVLSDAGKKVSPHAKFALTNSFGQAIYSGNDYAKLYRKAGLDFATEYSSCIYLAKTPIYNFDEFMRSFAPEMRSFGSIGYTHVNVGMITYSPWWFATHRYGGMGWYAILATGHQLLENPSHSLTKDAVLLGKTHRDYRLQQGVGKLFLAYQWKKRDIAVYYSQTSMQTAFLKGKETRSGVIDAAGPLHDFFYSRQGAFYGLEYLLHQYDFVAYDQVEDGILKNYKVLIMPYIISMSDKEVAAVRKFIADGGKVIADFAPGVYDELGFKRAEAPLPGIKLTGKIFDEMSASCRKELLDWLRSSGVKPLVESEDIVNIPGREAMHFTDGVNHVFPILHNASVSKDEKTQTFVFPVKGHLYDLRKGEYLGKTDRVTCRIPNANAVVYGVYPGKMQILDIRMPAAVKAGSDLKASFRAVMADGIPGKRIYYVQLIDPAGKTGFCMDRSLVAEDGKADFTFRMAFNDPAGEWTLKAVDVLTGTTAERKFTLGR